jgi:diaminopimelate decarboxylase
MQAHPAGPRYAQMAQELQAPVASTSGSDPTLSRVWPESAHRSESGELQIGGQGVIQLASQYGTPLFLFDEKDIRERAREFVDAYLADNEHGMVYYAAKAFLSVAIAKWVVEEGLGIDVASGGELAIAIRAGVPGGKLLMHGNNKSEDEIRTALVHGVARIVIDSFDEIVRVAAIAADLNIVAKVLVRATVGVEAHTHEFIATAHEDQKFGLSVAEGDVQEAVRRIAKLPSLHFVGLHSHIGSQIFDSAGFEIAATRVVSVAYSIYDIQGIECQEFNLGGGMGIAYLPEDDPLSVQAMAKQVRDIVVRECENVGIPIPALCFEPGRAIVGRAGITLYEVGTVKKVKLDHGERTYISVDGGMSDNIRTSLYGAQYSVALVSRNSFSEQVLCRVVGKHCESGDIVVRDAWLPGDVTPGDLIAVAATGAYCRSMASNYNQIPRPPVVSVREGENQLILRRETFDDLLALDPFAG